MKKRIALCFHGISHGLNFKNKGEQVTFSDGFESIKDNLIEANSDEYEFDVFFHSWCNDSEREIVALLDPLNFEFEESKTFARNSLRDKIRNFVDVNLRKLPNDPQRRNNIYSRWYSLKKSVECLSNYVSDSGTHYDGVFITRFDIVLLNPFHMSLLNFNNISVGDWLGYILDEEVVSDDAVNSIDLSNAQTFSRGFPHDSMGLQDFFFISSYENILERFANIYDMLPELIRDFGLSNHKIALGQIQKEGLTIDKPYKFIFDYYLSRWM